MIYYNYKTSLESDTVTESKQAEADVHPENLFKIHIPLLLSNSLKEKLTQNQFFTQSLGSCPAMAVKVRLKTEGDEKPQLAETSAIFMPGFSFIRRLASSTR